MRRCWRRRTSLVPQPVLETLFAMRLFGTASFVPLWGSNCFCRDLRGIYINVAYLLRSMEPYKTLSTPHKLSLSVASARISFTGL